MKCYKDNRNSLMYLRCFWIKISSAKIFVIARRIFVNNFAEIRQMIWNNVFVRLHEYIRSHFVFRRFNLIAKHSVSEETNEIFSILEGMSSRMETSFPPSVFFLSSPKGTGKPAWQIDLSEMACQLCFHNHGCWFWFLKSRN